MTMAYGSLLLGLGKAPGFPVRGYTAGAVLTGVGDHGKGSPSFGRSQALPSNSVGRAFSTAESKSAARGRDQPRTWTMLAMLAALFTGRIDYELSMHSNVRSGSALQQSSLALRLEVVRRN